MSHHPAAANVDAPVPAICGASAGLRPNRHARRAQRALARRSAGLSGLAGLPPGQGIPGGAGVRSGRPERHGLHPERLRNGLTRSTGSGGAGLDAVQPAFTALPSELTFGPATDISMGWDGTVWAIDPAGAPHLFDPVAAAWRSYGEGVDAATAIDETLYLFRGSEVLTIDTKTNTAAAPQAIAAAFPSLPDSFKLHVSGAAVVGGKLVLFSGGRYLPADGSSPRTKLTDLKGWPQRATWADGVVDATISTTGGVYLVRGDECVLAAPDLKGILKGPQPVSSILRTVPSAAGIDAAASVLTGGHWFTYYFGGPTVVTVPAADSPPVTSYLPDAFDGWPMSWNPVLRQAPSGRDGDLWSVLAADRASYIMRHDGDTWTQQPDQADHVSAGQDSTVMIASAGRLWRYGGGEQFNALAPLDDLVQVSVGDADTVWGRDSSNKVYRYDPAANTFSPATDIGQAVDLAANTDGTLWHAKPDDSNMHRFLSDVQVLQPGIPVQEGTVATVRKVAATSFGVAYCLAQDTTGATRAYRYDSPYVFKTSAPYNLLPVGPQTAVAAGLGAVFFTNAEVLEQGDLCISVVALDAQTGRELSRSAPLDLSSPEDSNTVYGCPVVDESKGLVYVGLTDVTDLRETAFPGQFLALDARDLTRVVWSVETPSSIDAVPAILGDLVIFSDRGGNFYAFDTSASLANPARPAAAYTWSAQLPASGAVICTAPTLVNGCFYAVGWVQGEFAHLVKFDPASHAVEHWPVHDWNDKLINIPSLGAPITVQLPGATVGDPPVVNFYVNGGDALVLVKPDHSTVTFSMPSGKKIISDLTWDANHREVWFGGYGSILYGFDADLKPVSHSPVVLGPAGGCLATPVVYTNAGGARMVLTGVYMAGSLGLCGYDPDNGNVATVPSGVTEIKALSAVTDGVIYAAGSGSGGNAGLKLAQVFGIRIDGLLQGLRDLVIESQLMQDPDETAAGGGSTNPGNLTPPSVARYQTHLTVVDDKKNPQPRQTVKIWADAPGTVITVDGRKATVGPGDAQSASATTGVDGSLVIVSDATDVNAPVLRVWTSFMDAYERIVVYPDQEWHDRVTRSYADPGVPAAAPDPSRPNLSTVSAYTGTPLFTADEKNQNVPQSVAGAIAQMNKGLNPGGGAPATLAGTLATLHAADPATPYVAYPDLAGMHYVPSNARARRTAAITEPVGLQLSRAGDGTHAYIPLSPSDARTAIDALTGTAWTAGEAGTGAATDRPQRLGNIFTDFWNWLARTVQEAVTTITQIVVSVAEDIVVGIQMIVNGVETVFKAVVRTVEDVVNVVGSFFLQLKKLVEDVIQALSVLFHFGEIMKTHTWLKAQLTGQVQTLKTALAQQGKPAVDRFFGVGEQAIAAFFDQVKAKIGAGQSIDQVQGMGTTAHTAMTAGPGRIGAGSSQAVQGSWGIQKLRSGLSAGGAPATVAAAGPADGLPSGTANPIADFVNGFVASLSANPQLKQSFAQLQSDLSRLLTVSSAGQFFSTLLDTLLDILKALLIGALALGEAFVDGVFGVIEDVIDLVVNVLNKEIDIPVLSWLYRELFGEPLTILDVLTLVAAIPVTLLFRVVTGRYPSQAVTGAQASGLDSGLAGHTTGRQAAPKDTQMLLGFFAGLLSVAYGILNGLNDATSEGTDTDVIGRVAVGAGLAIVLVTIPTITSDTPSSDDWAVYAFSVVIALVGALGLPEVGLEKLGAQLLSLVICGLCIILAGCSVGAYLNDADQSTNADLGFAANLVGTLAGMINPIKFQPAALGLGQVVAAVADVVTGLAFCGLELTITLDQP